MKKWWYVVVVLLLAMLFSAQTQKEERPLFVEGEVVVKLRPTADIQAFSQATGLTMSRSLTSETVTVYQVGPGQNVQQLSEELKARDDVLYAEPNYLYYASDIPNDPRFNEMWGLNNTGQTGGVADADIDAVEAWDTQKGSHDVLVAVIDTGVEYDHSDLATNIFMNPGETGTDAQGNDKRTNGLDDDNNSYVDDWHGWDFANDDNDPKDDNGHGTHVSGTIGAIGNNGVGVVGVNWNVKILPIKFLSAAGSGTLADAVDAIAYAVHFGAHVMNNSWGGGGQSQALEDAITLANNAGSLFVAAAGNEGNDNDVNPTYPASYQVPNVLAVAATDHNGNLATFGSGGGGGICGCIGEVLPLGGSNFGKTSVDVGAPGENILSTWVNNGYNTISGTSMATPHVAGVAALVVAQFPNITTGQLKQRLMDTAVPVPGLTDRVVTGGVVNAENAVSGSLTATSIP